MIIYSVEQLFLKIFFKTFFNGCFCSFIKGTLIKLRYTNADLKICHVFVIRVPKVSFRLFFLINWNAKLEMKFWFLFLYWSWDVKYKTKWFLDFQNNRTLKFKVKVRFSFFILIWKTKINLFKQILIKLVTISSDVITINEYEMIK